MLPSRHIIVSVSLGAIVWLFSKSLFAGLLCLFAGTLIDIDHLVEYIVHYGLHGFNFKECYWTCVKFIEPEGKVSIKKIYLLFHVGELAILLWVVFMLTKSIYLFSIALGYTVHLIMDASFNLITPSAYFMTCRIKNGFNIIRFIRNS